MYHVIAMMAAPAAAVTPDVSATPYAIFGGLVAFAMLLGKILEKGYEHLTKKEDERHPPIVQLDPDTLKLFNSLKNDVEKNQNILDDHLEEEKVVVEMMRDNTSILKDISRINERLVKHFDERMDHVDESLRDMHDQMMKMKRAV